MSSPSARWRSMAVVAAALGAAAATYLLVEYTTGTAGVCLTGSGCDTVRASVFAYPLGIPMPIFGLVFYLAAAWVAVRTLDPEPIAGVPPATALLLLGLVGVAVSAVLTGLEAFVIGAFCTWCLVSAAASVMLLACAVALWRTPPLPVDEARSSRARHQRARDATAERAGLRRTVLLSGGGAGILVAALLVASVVASGPGAAQGGGDALAPTTNPHLGNGAVTVVEFADFQCPGCAAVSPILVDLAQSNAATLVYRYFPLTSIHPNADASARAAAAADRQGYFWPMAEQLFATQADWEHLSAADAEAYFLDMARQLGMDTDRWQADLASPAVRDAISADVDYARQLQLPGTPVIYIGGQRYDGPLSAAGIRSAISAAGGS